MTIELAVKVLGIFFIMGTLFILGGMVETGNRKKREKNKKALDKTATL